jgi:adenosine/AMP kinase
MEISSYEIYKKDEWQCIIGHAGFIKTAEDLYGAMASAVPSAKFGIAFVEASGERLVRYEGNETELIEAAKKNALGIAAGHTFIILFTGAFPINVVKAIRDVPEVSEIFCATANKLQLIIATTELGKAVIGVVDGETALGVEDEAHIAQRRELLKKFGYKP